MNDVCIGRNGAGSWVLLEGLDVILIDVILMRPPGAGNWVLLEGLDVF